MTHTLPPQSDALLVKVVNGNLVFVREPLLVGHYRSVALTGTEKVLDGFLKGTMQRSLDLDGYPDRPGDAEVFLNHNINPENRLQRPRPEAVIVVGLGDEGALDAAELAHTVCQGVLAWAKRREEEGPPTGAPFSLAATLIGSGGRGMSAGQSARLVVRGVLEANERLARLQMRRVEKLQFIELYLDRATEAWRALSDQLAAIPGPWVLAREIATGSGALSRPIEAGYRGTGYDLVSAKTVRGEDGSLGIAYVVDTKRARAEVQGQTASVPLLQALVTQAASSENHDPAIARTLFRLVIPVELEPALVGSSETLIEVDGGTAGIPWELLDARGNDAPSLEKLPWAIQSKLLRKLQVDDFRRQVTYAAGPTTALVIGEPVCDARYPRLPSACEEAKKVVDCLEGASIPILVKPLFSPQPNDVGPDARMVLNALFERDWRIIHITGHGEPPESVPTNAGLPTRPPNPRGVVLSDDLFLGPAAIHSMRVVPDLVFVNCCHLGKRSSQQLLNDTDRPRFAATLAESLIREGVRCVIAAAWAIESEASAIFATTFYERLTAGNRFIDAVAAARTAARQRGNNTWAAFQCYGDPDWTLKRGQDEARPSEPAKIFASVASPAALCHALEVLTVSSRTDKKERAALPKNLAYLEAHFGDLWGDRGAVAEAFGNAWAGCHRRGAIEWYESALLANDGAASLRAAEQLGNLRARAAAELVANPDLPAADRPALLAQARTEIEAALGLLRSLLSIQPTVERESLCGSAYKRLAMVETLAEDGEKAQEAMVAMRNHYLTAEALARESRHPELFYPALNGMWAELIVDGAKADWGGFASTRIAEVRASLETKAAQDPDLWCLGGLIDLDVLEALGRATLAQQCANLGDDYGRLYERTSAAKDWASARDQLHFFLSARRSLPEAERQAGQTLLQRLQSYAGG